MKPENSGFDNKILTCELQKIKIDAEHNGSRVDVLLSELYEGYSRGTFQKLIAEHSVKLNGRIAKKSDKLKTDDELEFVLPNKNPEKIPVSVQMELEILYEDEYLLVVNKPAGLTVHMGSGDKEPTLVDGLLYHTSGKLSDINGRERPGIVHRIDKDTSGLLVVAKTNEAHESLAEQLAEHSMTRRYFAVAHGKFSQKNGSIDSYIIRDPKNRIRKKSVSLEKGENLADNSKRRAITHFEVLESFAKCTYLTLRLETGRTHQIRVHLSSINHAIVGDFLYGKGKNEFGAKRQMLHAGILGFVHPISDEYMEFSANPPKDFLEILEKVSKM